MLEKVISGGQSGVDQAGLAAARLEGYQTGGVMPKGWRTLDGRREDIGIEFNMKEHAREDYPPRTYENVRDSDATLRLFVDPTTAGERCTLKAINSYKRPHLDVNLRSPQPAKVVAVWIVRQDLRVLNIAGNSEKRQEGIFEIACKYLREVLQEVRKLEATSVRESDPQIQGRDHDGVQPDNGSGDGTSVEGVHVKPGA